jgi:hypothetical protein
VSDEVNEYLDNDRRFTAALQGIRELASRVPTEADLFIRELEAIYQGALPVNELQVELAESRLRTVQQMAKYHAE